MDILGEVENLAKQNPEQAKQVVDQAEKIVDEQTGGKFTDQIGQASNFVEGRLGIQDQGGDQAQQQA